MNEETKNENLVRSWLEDILLSKSEGSMNAQYIRLKAPDYWAEDYVAHHDPLAKGRDDLVARLAALAAAFSDVEIEILYLFGKGDMVGDGFRVTATQTGPFLGIPPAHTRVSWLQNEAFRIEAGKIVEGWVTRDWLALLQQLGALGGQKR